MPYVKEVCCICLALSNPFSNATVAVRYKYSNSNIRTSQESEAVFLRPAIPLPDYYLSGWPNQTKNKTKTKNINIGFQ